jgi:Lrp/AsnC family leucine-responsive transcriptional regulator
MSAVHLDIIDSRLVAALQKDNRVSVTELCDTIGLTPATCHRRLKRLRESGIIIKEAALVDPRLSARPLTVIMEITLAQNRIAFEKKLSGLREISMCWAVSGPVDFVAVGQFRDINHYREFMVVELIGDENIKRQNSTIVVDRLRFNLELEFLLEN